MRRQHSSAMDPLHAERITDGADVGGAGLVGVVVEEEPLPHLGWWRVFEKEEEVAETTEQSTCPKCGHKTTTWGDKHLCPQCDAVKLRLLTYTMLGMQFRQQQERSQR